MKNALLAVAILYGIAALGSPYFIGQKAEERTKAFFNSPERQALAQQGVELKLNHYQKGYFRSIANIHLTVKNPIDGTVLYENDIDADIAHAPLSLTGINAISITATGNKQPTGEFGQHVPTDFITVKAHKSVLDQILGHKALSNETILKPVALQHDDTNINFKGMVIEGRPLSGMGHADVQFSGLELNDTNGKGQITIDPFNLTLDMKRKDAHNAIGELKLDQLVINGSDSDIEKIRFSMKNFSESVNMIADQADDFEQSIGSAVIITADEIQFDLDEGYQSGGFTINDTHLIIGFTPDGDDYDINLTLQAKPEFRGAAARGIPIDFNDIDFSLLIAKFPRAETLRTLKDIQSQYAALAIQSPERVGRIMGQHLGRLFEQNITTRDLTIDLNAQINGPSGKLVDIKGNTQEHIGVGDNLMFIMMDPTQNIPRYFHGTTQSIYLSRTFLQQTGLENEIRYSGIPQTALDADGNLKMDVKITDKQILLNGEPAPF